MGMTATQHRASKKAGRPLTGRSTKYSGRILGDDLAYIKPVIRSILLPGRITYVQHSNCPALSFCRELVLHLAANEPFGAAKPTRALKIAVATIRDDTHNEFVRLIEATSVVPKYRIAIHRLYFDWDELCDPVELARIIRANGSEVLLAECGRGALYAVQRHLGDLTLPILTPCDPHPNDKCAIVLRLHENKTFDVTGGDVNEP